MINILEILKDAPIGTELYSPILGECTLDSISTTGTFRINVRKLLTPGDAHTSYSFNSEGKYLDTVGECLLFPSSEKRNWDGVIFREDLKEDTTVLCSNDVTPNGWHIRKYSNCGRTKPLFGCSSGTYAWTYIIPVSKFNFDSNSWEEKDNYGTGDSK